MPRLTALALALVAACAALRGAGALTYRSVPLATNISLSTLFHGATGAAAPTIVFLHGFPEGSWAWHAVMQTGALDAFQLVAPDLPGYNRSTVLGAVANYTIDKLVAHVEALIDAVTAGSAQPRVHLVAHDWGGGLAWWLAAARPERLLSLTIINMAHPLGWISAVRNDAVQQAASAYVLTFVNPASTRTMTANDFYELKSIFAAEAWAYVDEPAYESSWRQPNTVDAGLNYYRANVHPHCPLSCTTAACWRQGVDSTIDAMPNGGVVPATLPVKILWGMQDGAFDTDATFAYFPTKVGNFSTETFLSNTHWLANEAPASVAASIAKFIAAL